MLKALTPGSSGKVRHIAASGISRGQSLFKRAEPLHGMLAVSRSVSDCQRGSRALLQFSWFDESALSYKIRPHAHVAIGLHLQASLCFGDLLRLQGINGSI
jgi:hypothetical protein